MFALLRREMRLRLVTVEQDSRAIVCECSVALGGKMPKFDGVGSLISPALNDFVVLLIENEAWIGPGSIPSRSPACLARANA
jgi:hypothetical protein